MDFSASNDKLEKQQKARRELAKAKRAKEAELKEKQRIRDEEYQMKVRERKEEVAILTQQKEEAELVEITLTGGISFQQCLKPYRIDFEDDKVILPESCLVELNTADAFNKGPVLLRIWSSLTLDNSDLPENNKKQSEGGHNNVENEETSFYEHHYYSHCGIKEFSADEGKIGLPDKVIISLLRERKKEWVVGVSHSPGASDDGSPVTPFEGVCIADAQLQSSRRPCIATHRTA